MQFDIMVGLQSLTVLLVLTHDTYPSVGIPCEMAFGIPRIFLGIPRNKGVNFHGKFDKLHDKLTITTLVLKT